MDYPEDPRWRELLEAARGWCKYGSLARGEQLEAAMRAFDPPKPKRHTFGGVVFEEIGESETVERGQFYLYDPDGGVVLSPVTMKPSAPRLILRPVALEDDA